MSEYVLAPRAEARDGGLCRNRAAIPDGQGRNNGLIPLTRAQPPDQNPGMGRMRNDAVRGVSQDAIALRLLLR